MRAETQSKNPRSATDAQGLQRLFIGYCMLFDALKLCISKRLVEKKGSLSVLFTLELPSRSSPIAEVRD